MRVGSEPVQPHEHLVLMECLLCIPQCIFDDFELGKGCSQSGQVDLVIVRLAEKWIQAGNVLNQPYSQ